MGELSSNFADLLASSRRSLVSHVILAILFSARPSIRCVSPMYSSGLMSPEFEMSCTVALLACGDVVLCCREMHTQIISYSAFKGETNHASLLIETQAL